MDVLRRNPRTMAARSVAPIAALLAAIAGPSACSDDRESFVDPPADGGEPDTYRAPDTSRADAESDAGGDAALPEEHVECKTTPCAVALAARGGAHVCALLSDRTVACWGADDSGQLGRGPAEGGDDPLHGSRPAKVDSVRNATQISVVGSNASGTSCARIEDGTVMCWGSNAHGQLALDADAVTVDSEAHPVPTRVQGLENAERVDLASAFACASGAGKLRCWGWNSALQLGRGHLPKSHGGVGQVSLGARSAIAASGSTRNAFAITGDGELLSWGGSTWNDGGGSAIRDPLGRESSISPDGVPTPIPNLANVRSVSAGEQHACAIAGLVAYCWGKNPTGAIGNGTRQDVLLPYAVTIEAALPLREIVAGGRTTCARTLDGAIYCWGDNADGQLGAGNADATLYPVRVDRLGGHARAVAVMDRATCALIADGSVECWGKNDRGQLGLGTRDEAPHLSPQKVRF